MTRSVLAVISDLHAGATIGLCPPKVELDEGGIYKYSPGQKYLWGFWEESWNAVFKLAGKDPLYIEANGDLVEGSKKRTEVFASSMEEQANVAIACLAKPAARAKSIVLTRGTPFHVGHSGEVEDWIAHELGAHRLRSFKRPRFTISGVTFEFNHKGPKFGEREWYKENPMRYHIKSMMAQRYISGLPVADVMIYSHFHRYINTLVEWEDMTGLERQVRGIITPAWMLMSEWGNHAKAEFSHIGLIAFEIENGEYQMHKHIVRIDPAEDLSLP